MNRLARTVAAALAAVMTLLASAGHAQEACPPRLRVAFVDIDSPPYMLGSGDAFASPPGELVEITRHVLDGLACPYELVRRPMRRVFAELAQGDLEVAVGFAPDPDRMSRARFPLTPEGAPDSRYLLAETRVVYLTLARRQPALQAQAIQGRLSALHIGAVRGSEPEFLTRAAGGPVSEVTDISRGLSMLRAERIDLLALPRMLVRPEDLAAPPAIAVLTTPSAVMQYYAPVSQALWAQHPHFTLRLWRGLCESARQSEGRATICPRD